MITDFYIRAMSLIIFVSSIPCPDDEQFCYRRLSTGSALFCALFIFEFVLNRNMRIPEYQSIGFILAIFGISILSSFYNILASLELLKFDAFFGKSVLFEKYLFEHRVRIYLSLLMNAVNIGLLFYNNADTQRTELVTVFIVIYLVAVVVNYMAINKVQKYVDPPNMHPFRLTCCGGGAGDSSNEAGLVPVVMQQNMGNNAVAADAMQANENVEEDGRMEQDGGREEDGRTDVANMDGEQDDQEQIEMAAPGVEENEISQELHEENANGTHDA